MPIRRVCLALLVLAITAPVLIECQRAPAAITSPKAALGFNIGDDYQLANFTQMSAYFRKLDEESDRIKVVEYGKSSEGRPMLMAIITSPENHAKLDRYKEIARRLALAENLTDEQARALTLEGKAVVWVDGGLHASARPSDGGATSWAPSSRAVRGPSCARSQVAPGRRCV